jgi:cell division septation protein DedD
MKRGSYYVQIGLFGSEEALRLAIRSIKKEFSIILYEKVDNPNAATLYRLYVGPLSRDEGGMVLVKVRSLGYKDAVLKQG